MTVVGFHASHEQVHPRSAGRGGVPGRGGRVHRRHVLGPLLALERATGPQRLRLVVAGCGAGGDVAAVRGGERAGPALPPGHHRPGHRHPRRHVPRPLLGRAGHGRGLERAHHRRRVAAQGGAQRPAGRVRGGHPRPPPGRGGQPRRPGDGRPGPGVDPARRAGAAARRRRLAGDGQVGRRLGRWADHRRPAARGAPAGGRRLPRWRRRRAGGAPGPPVVGAGRGHGVGDRPRPVAHQRLLASAVLGHRDGGGLRRGRPPRHARGRRRLGVHHQRPRAPRRPPARPRRPRLRPGVPAPRRPGAAAVPGRLRRARSCPSSGSPCREADRHQRPLVEDGGGLLPRRRDLPRLGRRRPR